MVRTIILAVLCATALAAPACSCSEPSGKPCRGLQPSDVVFIGIVTDIQEGSAPRTGMDRARSNELQTVRRTSLKVEEWFSRGAESEIVLEQVEPEGMCATNFRMGQRYLVVTGRDSRGVVWQPDVCSGSGSAEGSPLSIEHYRNLRDGKRPASLYGTIWRSYWDLTTGDNRREAEQIADRKISLIGKPGMFSTVSNRDGDFQFDLVPKGKYNVSVDGAAKVQVARLEEPLLTVGENSCDDFSISLEPEGVISGRVINERGVPMRGAHVRVLPKNETPRYDGASDQTDVDGRFTVHGLLPGEYQVAVNFGQLDAKVPYPTTYYPSALERTDAAVVVISEAQKINEIEIRLTARQNTVKVRMTVHWGDGKPVRRAFLGNEGDTGLASDIAIKEIGPGVYELVALTTKLRRVRVYGACTREKKDENGKKWFHSNSDSSEPILLEPSLPLKVTIATVCDGEN
jgi:hypothetical protein